MANIPVKVRDRLQAGLKVFQSVLAQAKARDVNESDTVTIVKDILADIFGYDKYTEITSEHNIRGTYCDLAIQSDGKIKLLIEVKAAGIDLKDGHVKQAIDYGVNQGTDWVILTNGIMWRIYKTIFAQPVGHELVLEIDMLAVNPKNAEHLEALFLLTKEGRGKQALNEYHERIEAVNRYSIGAVLLTETIINAIRREVRRTSPSIKIEGDEIQKILAGEVIKRDVLEGEKADEARKKITRILKRLEKNKAEGGVAVPDAIPPSEGGGQ